MQIPNIRGTKLQFAGQLYERPDTDMIIVHHSASPDCGAADIHSWHLHQGYIGIGYHYVVRLDGTIEQGRPRHAVGAHAYGYNRTSIGICLAGNFDIAEPTDEQIEMLAMLIGWLGANYRLELVHGVVIGHGELMATGCPGKSLQTLIDDNIITGKAIYYQTH